MKAKINEVVYTQDGQHWVIVGYKRKPWGRYLAIRTDPVGRYPHGSVKWLHSTVFTATGLFSKRPGIVYRQNLKEGEHRGCNCQCCPHVKGFEPDA